jgi:leader peptidase (prepilin peptidase)/N-methyltransferase
LIKVQRTSYLGLVIAPLLLALGFEKFGTSFQFLAVIPLALVSGPLFIIDARTMKLPNAITYPSVALLLAMNFSYSLYSKELENFTEPIVNSSLFFLLFLFLNLATRGGVGAGDVKLSFVIGLSLGSLGFSFLFAIAMVSFILASFYSLFKLAQRNVGLKSKIPFGPFLILATWICLLLLAP